MPFIGCATLLLYFVLYYFITEHVCEASVLGYECGPCGVQLEMKGAYMCMYGQDTL